MRKYISKFHYLTQDLPNRSHIEQVKMACEAGANWIQYRCLSKTDAELVWEIEKIASICDDWGVTLILTNHYHLLDKVDAQGVHIEDLNADFKLIRKQIGYNKTLGGSANSFEDVYRIVQLDIVDYIGCGPFALTLTKPNHYPILGTKGYRKIIEKMSKKDFDIPILAVGGITLEDVDSLLHTGVFGIAISSAINHADHPVSALKSFYKKIH